MSRTIIRCAAAHATVFPEASERGLREGYVIKEINRRPVESEQRFQEAVAHVLSEGRPLLLLITNGRVSQYLILNPSTQ